MYASAFCVEEQRPGSARARLSRVQGLRKTMKRAWTWARAASLAATVTILGACGGGGGGGSEPSAPPRPPASVHGSCGEERDICLAGTYRNVLDSETQYLWNCDGSNGGRTAMCSLSKVAVCPNGAAASNKPLLCERGDYNYVISGIYRLPLDRVQLTNRNVQRHFAILDTTSSHAQSIGLTACRSYVTASEGCERRENRAGITRHPEGDEETHTGLIPFTQILDLAGLMVIGLVGKLNRLMPCGICESSISPLCLAVYSSVMVTNPT